MARSWPLSGIPRQAPSVSAKAASAGKGRLHAKAGLGVVIRVTDGEGNDFGTGIARLALFLPAGLYAVGWTTAGTSAESVVRVVDGGETTVRPPWEDDRPDRLETTSAFDLMAYGLSASGGAGFVVSGHPGSTSSIDRSSLIVEVVDREGLQTGDIAGDLHLLDGVDREVDSVSPDQISSASGSKAWAEVTPGRYRLRFRAQSGETLDQIVPVLKDRTTIIRMEVATATVMVHGSEGFTNTPTRGVDPARTVVVTSVPRDGWEVFDEQFRLTRLLLRDLASRQSSLSEEFLDRLRKPGTDPLLRVYGALVILSCLEIGVSPALDEDWPADGRQDVLAIRRWCLCAADMLGNVNRAGMPPDAIVGHWQIERLVSSDIASGSGKIAGSIRMPPMLECAWRWAIARTTIDRHALQDFASIRAAAKTAGGTNPWLCWNAAAAKGKQNPAPTPSDDQLETLLRSVAGKSRQLRQQQDRSRSDLVSPHSLPSEAAVTALRAEQVLDQSSKTQRDFESSVAALAVALSLPLAALPARLLQTEKALDKAIAKAWRQDAQLVDEENTDAPGWKRKVRFTSDPNLGRFGGIAERDGFKLEADFSDTKGKNWVTIHLKIIGPPGFDGSAVIYLHNSFKPPRYRYQFEDGVVRDKLTAWGGFTVGAWIPSRGIELELNLAEVDGAPRIIRER